MALVLLVLTLPPFLAAAPAQPNRSALPALRNTLASLDHARQTPAALSALRQWVHDMSPRLARYIKDPDRRQQLLLPIYQEAKLAGLAPELVMAVIQVESTFRADALSPAGATGLMQIMPFWITELGLPDDNLQDPARNLRYGCTILAHYLAVENGDMTRALARYNGSLGKTWYPERVMRALNNHWRLTGRKTASTDITEALPWDDRRNQLP